MFRRLNFSVRVLKGTSVRLAPRAEDQRRKIKPLYKHKCKTHTHTLTHTHPHPHKVQFDNRWLISGEAVFAGTTKEAIIDNTVPGLIDTSCRAAEGDRAREGGMGKREREEERKL